MVNIAKRCNARHPAGAWRCQKSRGHDGNHFAYVPVSDTAKEPTTWPRVRCAGVVEEVMSEMLHQSEWVQVVLFVGPKREAMVQITTGGSFVVIPLYAARDAAKAILQLTDDHGRATTRLPSARIINP